MPQLCAGIDARKSTHHCVVIDEAGTGLLSRSVANDDEVITLLAEMTELADGETIVLATDLN